MKIGVAVTETSFLKRVKLMVGDTSFPNLYKQMNIFGAKNNSRWDEFSKTSKIDGQQDEFFCPIKISVAYTNILDV